MPVLVPYPTRESMDTTIIDDGENKTPAVSTITQVIARFIELHREYGDLPVYFVDETGREIGMDEVEIDAIPAEEFFDLPVRVRVAP